MHSVRLCLSFGGDEGARTPDLDSAIVALSQLSYIPEREITIPYSGVDCKPLERYDSMC